MAQVTVKLVRTDTEAGAPSPPPSASHAPRAPAAPPPRALGRPLAPRPAWEDALLDLADGPSPRVAVAALVGFVLARIAVSGLVPWLAALFAGSIAYATWRFSRPRGAP